MKFAAAALVATVAAFPKDCDVKKYGKYHDKVIAMLKKVHDYKSCVGTMYKIADAADTDNSEHLDLCESAQVCYAIHLDAPNCVKHAHEVYPEDIQKYCKATYKNLFLF